MRGTSHMSPITSQRLGCSLSQLVFFKMLLKHSSNFSKDLIRSVFTLLRSLSVKSQRVLHTTTIIVWLNNVQFLLTQLVRISCA